ncbi:MAG: ESX-1 secretion-associated protein [Mycobacteriaceae bacterium]|nr:ESX-1 secretion-associated protein [Mycobacteriaceae bacterium]
MADLVAEPGRLTALAQKHDEVAASTEATLATTHIKTEVETSWGPLFGNAGPAFTEAERQRKAAIKRIQNHGTNLAAKLRTAADQYVSSDTSSGENLNEQIL